MSSYRQHLYHIVFRTKDSQPTIRQNNAHELYSYITGIIKQKNSHLYRINGVENHLHILTDMNPSIASVDFVKDIKVSASIWIKEAIYFLYLKVGQLVMVLLPVHIWI
jgi:REP element-mobilizing transposase RayT